MALIPIKPRGIRMPNGTIAIARCIDTGDGIRLRELSDEWMPRLPLMTPSDYDDHVLRRKKPQPNPKPR